MEENNLTASTNGDLALGRFSRRRKNFASFVIFDMEATGFKRRPRVTELCMMAVQVDEIKSAESSFPRVINKIQLCFNPESVIDPAVCGLTGLYNDALEQMATFKKQAALVSGFLASQPQPTCLIAHNGHGFDFPLLQAELHKADHPVSSKADIWCADTWQAFRVLDGLCAIPEWLALKMDKEKHMKRQTVNKTAGDQGASPRDTGTGTPGNKDGVRDAQDVSMSNNSPGKRHAQDTYALVENDSVTMSKHLKQDDSQLSITDSEIIKAYDALLPEKSDERQAQNTAEEQQISVTTTEHSKVMKQESMPSLESELSVTDSQIIKTYDAVLPEKSGECHAQKTAEEQHISVTTTEPPKVVKQESMPSLESQLSITDSELLEAYDALYSEQSSPVAATGSCMQYQMERTPDRSGSHISGTDAANGGHMFKKEQPLSVDLKEKQSVARRLFERTPMKTGTSHTPGSARLVERTPVQTGTSHTPGSAPASRSTPESSYKLAEIYKREFGQYPAVAHTAEDDCVSLLKLILKKSSQFIDFVEENAVHFSAIEPMF